MRSRLTVATTARNRVYAQRYRTTSGVRIQDNMRQSVGKGRSGIKRRCYAGHTILKVSFFTDRTKIISRFNKKSPNFS